MPRVYPYMLLDVFTDVPLLGNQLAVFLDADGLSRYEMQALARETKLSETTFCFPREASSNGEVRVRVFTTEEELPFAGHPTLGTATALRLTIERLHAAKSVTLQLPVGAVTVHFAPEQPPSGHPLAFEHPVRGFPVRGFMEQPLPRFGQQHDPAQVADALGLPIAALDASKRILTVSTGIPFVVVPLGSIDSLAALAIPRERAVRYLQTTDGKWFYVIAPGENSRSWRARMQFYEGEDPATGSAAGCAIAYLVQHGYAAPAKEIVIEQGREIGRTSRLFCSAELPGRDDRTNQGFQNGKTHYIRVGGCTIPVAEGRFFLS